MVASAARDFWPGGPIPRPDLDGGRPDKATRGQQGSSTAIFFFKKKDLGCPIKKKIDLSYPYNWMAQIIARGRSKFFLYGRLKFNFF